MNLSVKTISILMLQLLCLNNCDWNSGEMETLKTVEYVDIEKFMGDWYVISNIPTFIEKRATNALESYRLNNKGEIETTFTFHEDSPEGDKKIYKPKGFIKNNKTNAEWRMQFLWPFKMPYLIIDLDENYNYTVIGVPNRKYVWIMSRKPSLDSKIYSIIIDKLKQVGYDIKQIKKVTQEW
jgi:apolipoprotein D and lipocalin family protein